MQVGMVTLGCAKNTVDTEIMLGELSAQGHRLTNDPASAEVLIVNTCGFIQAAKEESIDTILEMAQWKRRGKCHLLVVTGCLAQRYGQQLLDELPEVDAVVGTGSLLQLGDVIKQTLDGQRLLAVAEPGFDYDSTYARLRVTPRYSAYVKIAEGCDNRCSYCAIPSIRGAYHSRSRESVVAEVQSLAQEGVQEINLIAQDTTYYGRDRYGYLALPDLLHDLLQVDGPAWYRLLYAYPTYFTPELIDLIGNEERILSYIDLPLQHISPRVLQAMRRPDDPVRVRNLLRTLRRQIPDVTLRTTFIVGFPGETEADIDMLADFMQEICFDHVGIFTYSREEGTEAAMWENQIAEPIKEERRASLMALQQKISQKRNQRFIGRAIQVLVEGSWIEGNGVVGRGRKDAPDVDGAVFVRDCQAQPGELITVDIETATEYDLVGVAHL